jgi:hypothetical protein
LRFGTHHPQVALVSQGSDYAAMKIVSANERRLLSIENELAIAREIQTSILPSASPELSHLRIAAAYRPMTAVAGDFYVTIPAIRAAGTPCPETSATRRPTRSRSMGMKSVLRTQMSRKITPESLLPRSVLNCPDCCATCRETPTGGLSATRHWNPSRLGRCAHRARTARPPVYGRR